MIACLKPCLELMFSRLRFGNLLSEIMSLMQLCVRVTNFNNEFQISCLRAEQTQLSRTLEKERQRAAESRQEYLAAKEEADTQEGRARQLEEEIRDLRQKNKQELHEALMQREHLQQVEFLLVVSNLQCHVIYPSYMKLYFFIKFLLSFNSYTT